MNPADYDPYNPTSLGIIAHELEHAEQDREYNENAGWLGPIIGNVFEKAYADAYRKNGYDNFFEWQAKMVGHRVTQDLTQDPGICLDK